MRNFLLFLLFFPLGVAAQKQSITLEDIYRKGIFRPEFVPAYGNIQPDSLLNPADVRDEIGKKLSLGNVAFSDDKSRLLIFTAVEPIYRNSSKAQVYIHTIATKKTELLDAAKVLHATFSPDGSKVAFVKDNNLYIRDIASGTVTAVTTDGKWNNIINGNCDWVYEEEFSFARAFQWSPKGNFIAYYRFDESRVKEYQFAVYDGLYPSQYSYKYPKAGEANSLVEIHIYDINRKTDTKADIGSETDIYIPRIKWTQDDNTLCITWLNRLQNNMKLLLANAASGSTRVLYEETNQYFIEINDDLRFLADGKSFILTSEKNGFTHIYLYGMDGKEKAQVSKGNYEVADIAGIDEKKKMVYYTMGWPTPMDRHLFVTDFAGKKTTRLTAENGWHNVVIKNDFTEFYDYFSTINTPQTVRIFDIRGKLLKNVAENAALKKVLSQYDIARVEMIKVPTSKNDSLNGWILRPTNFDPAKKYPVLFCNYGGPGSQQVTNRYGAVSPWHQMMAQKGYIIACFDNTGTGFRGEAFKKKTYLRLGQLEIEDQVDAAKYLGTLSYIDKNRIGHYGWSYGGFMSSLAITKGAGVFSAAVAGAPVTSWRYYDNIYTERYMRTPQENAKGYDETAPMNFTDKIKGKFLIIHGTADDNVHYQNSTMMVNEMISKNIRFESAYYPNQRHGVRGGNAPLHLWTTITEFFLKNL
jgi:dipeptidyl-peptidase 4